MPVDQTPTPTRFLRNCEEAGLFQELEDNPFDEDFKSATNDNDGKSEGNQNKPIDTGVGKNMLQ